MIKGYLVGHEPSEEREAWELRVLGGVIRQALEDMVRGDGEAEAWLVEAIGIGREDGLRLGQLCLPRWPGGRWYARGPDGSGGGDGS